MKKFTSDKYLKILVVFLFGMLNIGAIVLLIELMNLVSLTRDELYKVAITILIIVFLNYAALQAFADE